MRSMSIATDAASARSPSTVSIAPTPLPATITRDERACVTLGTMSAEPSVTQARSSRVIVAGSGVGAIETVLGLRALAASVAIDIDLIAAEDHFVYRPLAVVEPFGYPPPYR